MQTNIHHREPHDPAVSQVEHNSVSVAHMIGVLRRYSRAIVLSLIAVVFAYAVIALVIYSLSPSVVTTRVPFRLEFDGAERGEYPNGLKFSSSEIVSPQILNKVYIANELARFLSFQKFRDSMFIQESSRELQRLEAEFQSRLSDPRLSSVDRERIERDYALRTQSLRHSDFAIVMTGRAVVRKLPSDLREKVLNDVLRQWAEVADKEKGATMYRLPVLSTNIIPQTALRNAEPVIGLDILRSRINRILTNAYQISGIPGAETVRVGKNRVSLAEIRIALEDVRRFQIEPLIVRINQRGLVNDPRLVATYFQTQLGSTLREVSEAQARVNALQVSLASYMGRRMAPAATADSAESAARPARDSEMAVVPQLSDSFIDRVIQLVADTKDTTFRQELLESANKETFLRLLPAQKEVEFYADAVKALPTAPAPQRDAELKAIGDAQASAYAEVIDAVRQLNLIYELVSRNLNPESVLYTRTGPMTSRTERSVSLVRLAIIGIAITLLSLPLILAGSLLHARIREEEIAGDEPDAAT